MDWPSFLSSRNINYVDSGPNVARNHITIHCVWCGNSDPSHHLSISLEGKGFRCWRNPKHSGRNPAKLIQALLNCSWEQANELAGQQKTLPSDFISQIRERFAVKPEKKKTPLMIPEEFRPFISLHSPVAKPYVDYLKNRGFSIDDISNANNYGIYYATRGDYKGRIIFTVFYDSELVSWTGRTIYPSEIKRYKTLTNDEDVEPHAIGPISDYLLFHDRTKHKAADTIVLVEGPFDAWKTNILGEKHKIVSTCFFTSTLSNNQLTLLHELLPRFKNKFLLLDQETFTKSAKIKADLAAFDVKIKRLPIQFKDPAEIKTTEQLMSVLYNN